MKRSDGAEPRVWASRATLRVVPPGSILTCVWCGEGIRCRHGRGEREVIANVYDADERWERVEHFHEGCYVNAGEPHGVAA